MTRWSRCWSDCRVRPAVFWAWYMHLQTEGNLHRHWTTGRFLLQQGGLAVITAGLWLAVRPRRIILG